MSHVKSFEEMNPEQQFAYLIGQRSRDAEFEQLTKERDEAREQASTTQVKIGERYQAAFDAAVTNAEVAQAQVEALREGIAAYEIELRLDIQDGVPTTWHGAEKIADRLAEILALSGPTKGAGE